MYARLVGIVVSDEVTFVYGGYVNAAAREKQDVKVRMKAER
jgi:hypothetical protein